MSARSLGSSKYQQETYDNLHENDVDRIKNTRLRTLVKQNLGTGAKRILELGCGSGQLLEPFCMNNECYGVDISSEQLKIAKEKGYEIFIQDLEIANFPFTEDFFDIVVSSEVIEHLVNTEHFMNEINRGLRKKGLLLMSFPNVSQPISWLMTIFLDLPPLYCARIYSPHVRDFTVKLMEKLLKIKGFTVTQIEGTYVYPYRNMLSRFLARKIPRLGEKIIIVAKKEHEPLLLPSVIWDVRDFSQTYSNFGEEI
jgi:2-polyprenyl-3-methyl-5-hydroxy-6-metoxy-1,4-benzoquinol methylase